MIWFALGIMIGVILGSETIRESIFGVVSTNRRKHRKYRKYN